VVVGRERYLADWSIVLDDILRAAGEQAAGEGDTSVFVGWDGEARGMLVVADTVKIGAVEVINELRSLGLRAILLTGDNERSAAMSRHNSASTRSSPRCYPPTSSRSCAAFSKRVGLLRWLATA
jgi:cation transport ATPase